MTQDIDRRIRDLEKSSTDGDDVVKIILDWSLPGEETITPDADIVIDWSDVDGDLLGGEDG